MLGHKFYYILVYFDSPDGSTSWDINFIVLVYSDYFSFFSLSRWQHMLGHIFYYMLVYFDSPDGTTSWVHIFYYILVYFDSRDGSTSWVIYFIIFQFILTLQMAA